MSRDTIVHQAALALVEAANIYKNEVAKGENNDGFVEVEIPGGTWLPIDQLGDACSIAKRSVGKLEVVSFQSTGQVFVRQVASGYTHGLVVSQVNGEMGNATLPYSCRPHRFIGVGIAGLYGTHIISAPDVTVQSLGQPNGEPTRDSERGPLFFAEVESANRSLPELIRHLGMLLVNFPNLNGVLGIKGEEDDHGKKMNAIVLIEWRTMASGGLQPHVMHLVDFGPHPYSDTRKRDVNDILQLPLPRKGVKAQSGEHGAGAMAPLPEWKRFDSGMDAAGNPVIISIPLTLLLAGAHSTGAEGTIINIPADALPANINLARLVRRYRG